MNQSRFSSSKNIITKIHLSDIYGTFIEIGAGQPLVQKLFEINGASNTIYFSMSPYSKEYQIERYGPHECRAVSPEMIQLILANEKLRCDKFNITILGKKINLVWASSFQLNTSGVGCSHGWIGYQYHNEPIVLYHITFPRNTQKHTQQRSKLIEKLSEICLLLLYRIIKPDSDVVPYVDGVFHGSSNGNNDNLKNYNIQDLSNNTDIYWVVNPNRTWERLETHFRCDSDKPIVLYKGSFNPLHEGHLAIVAEGQRRYPNSPLGLMISTNTYQKKTIGSDDLYKRIKMINDAGLYCIICDKGMFAENIIDLQLRLGRKIVFLVGWDTYVRMESVLFQIENVDYLIFNRNGKMFKGEAVASKHCKYVQQFDYPISSTEIRNGTIRNN